jgi:NAD+ synthetase
MKIALLQLNFTVGDVEGNFDRLVSAINKAAADGAQLCVASELAVTGYPPRDLLLNSSFVEKCRGAVDKLSSALPDGVTLIVGGVDRNNNCDGNPLKNTAWVVKKGEKGRAYYKWLLPTYDVFDEQRYFEPSKDVNIFETDGTRVGITICEDVWNDRDIKGNKRYSGNPVSTLVEAGAEIIVNLSASPFNIGKQKEREALLGDIAGKYSVPVCYANQVGGNDDLVFDGRSCVFGKDGQLAARAYGFKEDILIIDTDKMSEGRIEEDDFSKESEAWRAMVCGVRDYMAKTGFTNAVIGLSGGIDSSLTAAVAVEALGAENVLGILMPSPYSSKGSVDDSLALAANLGIKTHTIAINSLMDGFEQALEPVFKGLPPNVAEENIQSRIRGNIVMAVSNKLGALLLTTGNKSELAVGYCTIYGDMAGGLAVISDLFKSIVFDVCRWLNTLGRGEIIPPSVISKPPSAELRPDQKDEDSLPPYEILDRILELRIEYYRSEDEIIAETGFDPEVVAKVLKLVKFSEFKRKQAAPGLKITSRAFGTGWRMPIACRFRG